MSTHITSHCFRLGLAALLLLTASTASAQWPQGLGGDRNDEVTVVKTAPGGDLVPMLRNGIGHDAARHYFAGVVLAGHSAIQYGQGFCAEIF